MRSRSSTAVSSQLNAGLLTPADAAKAKLWATEMEFRVLDGCQQLFGGYGYMREYPIARAAIDARVTRVYGGTSEIMREIIGRDLALDPKRDEGLAVSLEDLVRSARGHGLGDIPRRSARRHPDKIAIIDGEVTLTFAEFDELVDRAAAALGDNGLGPGDRVALLARNCWHYAVLAFATARAAVVLVPLNFMLTAEEIAYILGHCRATAFIVECDLVAVAEDAMRHGGNVATRIAIATAESPAPPGWTDFEQCLATTSSPPTPEVHDDQLLRVMYTSGTESRPKGVMHTSRSLMWQYVSTITAGSMSTEDVEIHSLPLYHCAQLDNFLATDVYLGATSILLPRPDPELVLRTIERYAVTNYFAPPTVWISLLRCPVFDQVNLSSLRKGYYGASAMPTEILHEIRHPPTRRPALELLRTNRNRAACLGAGSGRPRDPRRCRWAPRAQRRNRHPR